MRNIGDEKMKEKRFKLNGFDVLMRTQGHERYLAMDAEYANRKADNGLPYTNPMLSRKYRLLASLVSIKKDGKEYATSIPDVEAWEAENVGEDDWNFLYAIYDWIVTPSREYIEILKTLEPEESPPPTRTPLA
jgi:hypothetical protein